MTNDNNRNSNQVMPQQFIYPGMYQQEDEIDLIEVFSALFAQWRWLVGLTFGGTLLAVLIALMLPKQYEVDARLALPSTSDIQAINVRGYEEFTNQTLFSEFYEQLRSANQLRTFLVARDLLKKLRPNADEGDSEDELFSDVYEAFSIEVLEPLKKKGEENDSPPTLIGIKLLAEDEGLGAKVVNQYVEYINQYVLGELSQQGQNLKDLEKERIEREISTLRKKETVQRISKIATLSESYKIASAMGIKKPTTIEALSQSGADSKTLVSLGVNDKSILALMGTEYLGSEIETLLSRGDEAIHFRQIPGLKEQMEAHQIEQKMKMFEGMIAADLYISELPGLYSRLDELNQLDFNFKNARLYRLDKAAMLDGKAEKPNRKLIVAVGFVLSAMLSLFIVLIMNAIKKRSEAE